MTLVRVLLMGVAVSLPVAAGAQEQQQQQPPAQTKKTNQRRTQTIEIRGQVPTPQVVTVRPREVPTYGNEVLGTRYDARSFSTGAAAPYQLVPQRQLTGGTPLDSIPPGVAKMGTPAAPGAAARGAAAAEMQGLTSVALAGARSAEMEAMRHEIALRRARLDSLSRLQGQPAGFGAGLPPSPPVSAADSARRAEEISAIRRELEYRRSRLDSLQNVINQIGKGHHAPKDSTRTPH